MESGKSISSCPHPEHVRFGLLRMCAKRGRAGLEVMHMALRSNVAVLGPDPLLSITVESRGSGDDLHVHPAGQGVWVARMAAELGAWPVLCCLIGGETGATLEALLSRLPGERRAVHTAGANGSYVVDARSGERSVVASVLRPPPERHELDDLIACTCAAAMDSSALVVCNPYPPDGFPNELYETVVADVQSAGIPVIVDLSSPRLDATLAQRPDLVKLNDWELAEYVCGPVDGVRALIAAERLLEAGARAVAVTRAEAPILVATDSGPPYEIIPPSFPRGHREGCGDSMTGAVAAGLARGLPLRDALVLGAAAGSTNYLRHGLGTGRRAVVEQLARHVRVRDWRNPRTPTRA
jgi:1-phosphofructokinase